MIVTIKNGKFTKAHVSPAPLSGEASKILSNFAGYKSSNP